MQAEGDGGVSGAPSWEQGWVSWGQPGLLLPCPTRGEVAMIASFPSMTLQRMLPPILLVTRVTLATGPVPSKGLDFPVAPSLTCADR